MAVNVFNTIRGNYRKVDNRCHIQILSGILFTCSNATFYLQYTTMWSAWQ